MKNNSDKIITEFHELYLARREYFPTKLPNFVGIGPGRCGTTSLYKILKNNNFFLPPIKEINFFGIRQYPFARRGITISEYHNYFLNSAQKDFVGEISPAYFSNIDSIDSIKDIIPNTKIIITLRNPVDRFLSQYYHHLKFYSDLDLSSYIQIARKRLETNCITPDWISPERNLLSSQYEKCIEPVLKNFAKENIITLYFEDLKTNEWGNKLSVFFDTEIKQNKTIHMNKQKNYPSKNSLSDKDFRTLSDIFQSDIEKYKDRVW